MNVTLAPNEHSARGLRMTNDMEEFKDYVNCIEMEDITSSGLFFTWIKNLFKVKAGDTSGVLKKLDRIMGNEVFIDKFSDAYAIFQPYLISDHHPNVLVIPKTVQARRKSFKFVNLVAIKEDFLPVVSKKWCEEYAGCQMFNTVKKLKSLKRDLNRLAWKDGNLFENVQKLKDQLKDVQVRIDKEPNKKELRVEEALVLDEYVVALKDEEKFLYQKVKVKWLSEGDRNNAFFHKVLKSRSHRSKISTICDDMGNKFSGNDVASKFVKHFEGFLGCESPVKDLSPISALFKNKLSMEEASFKITTFFKNQMKLSTKHGNISKDFYVNVLIMVSRNYINLIRSTIL
ncbi:hypothetical protein Tco_0516812 [Tanacetum coccineum]